MQCSWAMLSFYKLPREDGTAKEWYFVRLSRPDPGSENGGENECCFAGGMAIPEMPDYRDRLVDVQGKGDITASCTGMVFIELVFLNKCG